MEISDHGPPDGGHYVPAPCYSLLRVERAAALDQVSMVRQAGAIVFRVDDGMVRVLLVRAKKDPGLWVFPKGHLDSGEPPTIAALREAFEEAGVTGLILGPAGPTLTFRSGDETVAVDYYLIHLTAEMASPEGREKLWLVPEEAEARLVFHNARLLLRTALQKLQDYRTR